MRLNKRIRWFRWLGYFVLALLIVVSLDLIVLAHPNWSLDYSYQIDNQTFYSDQPIDEKMEKLFQRVSAKTRTWPFYDAGHKTDICVFHERKNYNFYRRLSLVGETIPGFNLSIVSVSFVSIPRLNEIKANSYYAPRYSVFEGDLVHGITHELVHDYFVEAKGLLSNYSLPRWKREGLAEYLAGVEPDQVRESLYSRALANFNEPNWSNHVREYNRWELVVEYLINNEQLTIDQLVSEDTEFESCRSRLQQWLASN